VSELEGTSLKFPCRFPIKAMGKASDDFDALVVQMVRRHAPDLNEAAVSVRQSRGGRWVSVTVVIQAKGRDQLDAIYQDLSAHERIALAF
jgi:putative lipoic acid-binding regulatory protein